MNTKFWVRLGLGSVMLEYTNLDQIRLDWVGIDQMRLDKMR